MGLMGWAQMAAEESALESIGQANPLTERCRDIAPNERHTQVERPACASTEKMCISPIYRAIWARSGTRVRCSTIHLLRCSSHSL